MGAFLRFSQVFKFVKTFASDAYIICKGCFFSAFFSGLMVFGFLWGSLKVIQNHSTSEGAS